MNLTLKTVSSALVLMAGTMKFPKSDTPAAAAFWLKIMLDGEVTHEELQSAVFRLGGKRSEMPAPHDVIAEVETIRHEQRMANIRAIEIKVLDERNEA